VNEDGNDFERKRKAAEDLAWHDRQMASGAVEASRDALHDSTPGKKPGEYTTKEARDRAAHTPGLHEREESGAKSAFTNEERKLLKENENDLAKLYPTDRAWAESYPSVKPSENAEQRQQQFDERELAQKSTKEVSKVTLEQKANVDKALSEISLSNQIGGASEVNQPKPNDPTPIDKSKDIGQDLNKAGVRMEKD
jgi:hypothetical protein